MKKLILLLTTLSITVFSSAQVIDFKKSIDSFLNYLYEHDAFSGNVMLEKNGETIYSANRNKFLSQTDNYRIGSVTKVFTAIIIFQLIEEGKLSLNTKLNNYYPSIKNAENITIANLLNHTSGIYDFLNWKDYYTSKSQVFSKDKMLSIIQKGKPDFRPGKDCNYSNSNYLLLGYIIEDITGKSYAENVQQRIAYKIDLKKTYVETSEEDYKNRNRSYKFDGAQWSKESETHPSFTGAAGAIVSNTKELSQIMFELFKGNLVSKESLTKMQQINNSKGIGYGLFIMPFYKKSGYGHSGRIDEFHAFTAYFPSDSLSLSVVSNGIPIKLNDVVIGVLSQYFDTKFEYPNLTEYTSPSAPQEAIYFGTYKALLAGIIPVGKFQIIQAGANHLFLKMYNQGNDSEKVLLKRTNENEFYAYENNATLQFIFNKKGEVEEMFLRQGTQSIKCKKVE